MSWTDKEISEMARKAEAEHAFTYQDSFWEEMEAMLPAKKKRIWPLFLAFIVPVVAGSAFLLNWTDQDSSATLGAKTMNFTSNHALKLHGNFNLPCEKKSINIDFNEIDNPIGLSPSNASERILNPGSVAPKEPISERKSSRASAVKVSSPIRERVDGNETIETYSVTESKPQSSREMPLEVAVEQERVDYSEMNSQESVAASEYPLETKVESELISSSDQDVDRLPIVGLSGFERNTVIAPTMLVHRSKRRYYSAYGEAAYSVGENYTKEQIGHTEAFSMSAGARLTKNKLFVQAGLGVVAEKVGLELSQRTKIYNYSVSTFENRMSYKQIYRAILPIQVGIIQGKHTLQVGGTASYILSSKMNYAYLENESMKRNETIYGETVGWTPFALKCHVGYGFSIFPSTTLGANFQIQLTNQLDRKWTTNENRMPVAGQIFIRKTIR